MKRLRRAIECSFWLAALAPLAGSAQTATVKETRINVRARACTGSEIVARLQQDDAVTVFEILPGEKTAPDEPAQWARILMPTNTPVWVNAHYIDPTTKAVRPRRLNLRAGPGENYSVVGRIEEGTVILEKATTNDWIQIETPPTAYAFVALSLLSMPTPAAPPPQVQPTAPPPAVEPAPALLVKADEVKPAEPSATPTADPSVPAVETAAAPAPAVVTPAAPAETPPAEPPPKRVVQREGLVRRTISIVAPSEFELKALDTGKPINFLHSATGELRLKDYHGKKVRVSGEEGLDERWPSVPVLRVESIEVIE